MRRLVGAELFDGTGEEVRLSEYGKIIFSYATGCCPLTTKCIRSVIRIGPRRTSA
jgi:hypothetical protein